MSASEMLNEGVLPMKGLLPCEALWGKRGVSQGAYPKVWPYASPITSWHLFIPSFIQGTYTEPLFCNIQPNMSQALRLPW